MEEFAKREYPDYVKESLLKSGYDSFEKLRMLHEGSVKNIEEYLKTKLLPAHKDFILDIINQIEKMDANKKTSQCEKQKKPDSGNPMRKRKQPKKIVEGEVKCKSVKPPQGLKCKLVEKVRKYVESNDLIAGNENMTNDNVIGFKRSSVTGKYLHECYFKCPFCEKSCSVKCNQAKTWDTKNIYSHLNKYHKRDQAGSSYSAPTSSTESKAFLTPVIQSVYTMHPTTDDIKSDPNLYTKFIASL